MFSKSIIESDAFLDMPCEAQMLYIHLNLACDDDGFCDNPRSVMRQCGASNDSMKILIAKKFVLTFEKKDNFIVVIKHWRMNNYIRKDNYRETKYKEFMRALYYDENKSYSMNPDDGHKPCITDPRPDIERIKSLSDAVCIPSVDDPYTSRIQAVDDPVTQDRIVKDSKEKDSIVQDSKGKRGTGEKPALSEKERMDRIAEHAKRIKIFSSHNYNTSGLYSLAAADGISREEIEAYIAKGEQE